jgi:hypothetical protein
MQRLDVSSRLTAWEKRPQDARHNPIYRRGPQDDPPIYHPDYCRRLLAGEERRLCGQLTWSLHGTSYKKAIPGPVVAS